MIDLTGEYLHVTVSGIHYDTLILQGSIYTWQYLGYIMIHLYYRGVFTHDSIWDTLWYTYITGEYLHMTVSGIHYDILILQGSIYTWQYLGYIMIHFYYRGVFTHDSIWDTLWYTSITGEYLRVTLSGIHYDILLLQGSIYAWHYLGYIMIYFYYRGVFTRDIIWVTLWYTYITGEYLHVTVSGIHYDIFILQGSIYTWHYLGYIMMYLYYRGVFTRDSIWDKLVFKKVQALMGGRVRFSVVGSAPLSANVLTFSRVALGCLVSISAWIIMGMGLCSYFVMPLSGLASAFFSSSHFVSHQRVWRAK